MPTEAELGYLSRCVELAAEALEAGDEPFGSVLVTADGDVVAEDRNRIAAGDPTRHPEFELARWAIATSVDVQEPVPELVEQVRALHRRFRLLRAEGRGAS